MSARLVAPLFVALMLLAVVPPPTAGQAGELPRCDEFVRERYLACIEALHATPDMAGVSHNLYAVGFRPVRHFFSGFYEALIVGGIPGEFTTGLPVRSLVLLYDGQRVSKIYDKEGPQLVDVDWAPDGSYALITSNRKTILRVDPPTAQNPAYRFTNLWDDCNNVGIINCAEATFYGHQVSFHPSGRYAWITGSSLLEYDGRMLSVVDPGADIAWRSIGWEPNGQRALLSALVCVDENNPNVDVACVGNVTSSRIVPGRIILADTVSSKLCEVSTYGRFNVRRAEVNGITWDPSGAGAYLYGDDDFHGTILKFDARATATGTTPAGCPQLSHAFQWLNLTKTEGEFNEMTRHPQTGRWWLAGGGGQEMWEGNGDHFLDAWSEHAITRGKGTIYYGVDWNPDGNYLLVSGYAGRLYKFVPANLPFTRITTPKNNTMVTGDVLIAGRSFSPSQFDPIERVEVNLIQPDGQPRGWRPANLTGTLRSMTNWTFPWDTTVEQPGVYVVQARALQQGNWSNLSNRTVRVVRPGGLAPPTFTEPTNPADNDGNYTLKWTAASGDGIEYDLEEAGLPAQLSALGEGAFSASQNYAFAGDERLIFNGTATEFAVEGKQDGQYFYRVRARTANAVSAWSQALPLSVAIDTDGDGYPDADEIARGGDPQSATSSPDDFDGDGVPNRDDAFPWDAAETLDSDGDGYGDNTDRYKLDPRDWEDGDNDNWGNNAERRLASNPFDPQSTPDSDDDLDGCLNRDEADGQTNPKDASSAPAFCATGRVGTSGGPQATPFPAAAALAALGLAALGRRQRR